MPFLEQAKTITVVSVDESRANSVDVSSAAVVSHLARRGIKANITRLMADHTDIDQIILSAAVDEGLNLMIMGGYGHSRLQERFLGGVTRGMVRSMTLPTLMSH